jgi:hypothetical protein
MDTFIWFISDPPMLYVTAFIIAAICTVYLPQRSR